LIAAYHPARIYLFGSRARGVYRPDSDYDILIVINDDAPRELQSAGKAYEALWGIRVPVDVLVLTESAFNERLHVDTSLPSEVIREGKILHAA
jgi:predicted nucleotidyltransferase